MMDVVSSDILFKYVEDPVKLLMTYNSEFHE